MRVLLDTCVLSELRRSQGSQNVRRAIEKYENDELFISVVSMGELAKGITLLRDGNRKQELSAWLETLEKFYADRILPIDAETAQLWGELTAAAQSDGKIIPAADGVIAATARQHGLRLLTRNTDHFLATGVLVTNPWL